MNERSDKEEERKIKVNIGKPSTAKYNQKEVVIIIITKATLKATTATVQLDSIQANLT
jgi:hypothetical protein